MTADNQAVKGALRWALWIYGGKEVKWIKYGESYGREYMASGIKGNYKIDLDQPPIDRWAIFLNGQRLVENIYYEKNAERIAEHFDRTGETIFPGNLRPNLDGGRPRFIIGAPKHTPMSVANLRHDLTGTVVMPTQSHTKLMNASMIGTRLAEEIQRLRIEPDRTSVVWSPWQSGVYCMLDAVFSARTQYASVVVPLLKRLHQREDMSDCPSRTFLDFIRDVNAFGEKRFEGYASEVMNRQWVGGRLKVAVAYDAARFFDERGLQTMEDLQTIGNELQYLILVHLKSGVVGIGPALANYFLALLGNEDRIKLDTMLLRFWERLDTRVPNPQSVRDYEYALNVYRHVARMLGTSPARLDKAVWSFESTREGGRT